MKKKTDRPLTWLDVVKAAEAGNKAFDKWEAAKQKTDELNASADYGERYVVGINATITKVSIKNLQQPDTPLHDPNYPIHWQIWVKAQIEERFFCKPRKYVMKELMQETRGCINPKWISQFCCPACDGTGEFDVDGEESEQCLNCDGYGWLIHLEVE